MAAGLSVASAQLEEFRMAFSNYVRTHLMPADFIPKTQIEALVAPADWTLEMVEELELLNRMGWQSEANLRRARDSPAIGICNWRRGKTPAHGDRYAGDHVPLFAGTRESWRRS